MTRTWRLSSLLCDSPVLQISHQITKCLSVSQSNAEYFSCMVDFEAHYPQWMDFETQRLVIIKWARMQKRVTILKFMVRFKLDEVNLTINFSVVTLVLESH